MHPYTDYTSTHTYTYIHLSTHVHNYVLYTPPKHFPFPVHSTEQARLLRAYAEDTAQDCVELKATTLLSILELQKPHKNSKARHHSSFHFVRIPFNLRSKVRALFPHFRSLYYSFRVRDQFARGIVYDF